VKESRAKVEELMTDDELRKRHLNAPGVQERLAEAMRIAAQGIREKADADGNAEDLLNPPRERS
jgi:hypothetical protein